MSLSFGFDRYVLIKALESTEVLKGGELKQVGGGDRRWYEFSL